MRSRIGDGPSGDIAPEQLNRVPPQQSGQWARRFKIRHLRRTVYVNCAADKTPTATDSLRENGSNGRFVGGERDGRAASRPDLTKLGRECKVGGRAVRQMLGQPAAEDGSNSATQPNRTSSGRVGRFPLWQLNFLRSRFTSSVEREVSDSLPLADVGPHWQNRP